MFGQKSPINSPMISEKVISDIMKEVDKNRDGFISYEEFNNALASILD
jgi:Ca2+-binding EF-hand superfamily protein